MFPFKKKKVPDELPEIPEDLSKEIEEKPEDGEIIKNHLNSKEPEVHNPSDEKTKDIQQNNEELISNKKTISEQPPQQIKPLNESLEMDDGFFSELQNNMFKEVNDLNKLEKWYNNKFLPGDVVNEMRGYWENKKTDSILKILGKNFQEKISGKMSSLQALEKEWQDIYFNLIEKEEEIKDKEKELKKMLKEFIELCKRRKRKN